MDSLSFSFPPLSYKVFLDMRLIYYYESKSDSEDSMRMRKSETATDTLIVIMRLA